MKPFIKPSWHVAIFALPFSGIHFVEISKRARPMAGKEREESVYTDGESFNENNCK
jgi:hypothetical protein